jgi:hypothetical protein
MNELSIKCDHIVVTRGIEVTSTMHRFLEPVLRGVDVDSLAEAIQADSSLRKALFDQLRDEISEFCLADDELSEELKEALHPTEEDPL